ncbi:ZN638 protein, partial [Erpornis zantholeuca]|nr:ZN638 protein [Erpornis zantholeuca]
FVLFLESCAPLVNSLNLGLASPLVLGPPPFQLAQIKTHLALRHLASGGPAPPHAGFRQALLKDAMFSPRGTLPPRPRGPKPSGTKPPGAFGARGTAGPPRKPAPATPQAAPQRFSAQDAPQCTASQRIDVRVTLHRADPRKVKEKSNLHQEQKAEPRPNRWDGGPCPGGPKPPGPPLVLEQSSNPQNRYTPESASSILASFGLSNEDLEELSRYPDDQLTPENMPRILREIRIRKMSPPMPPVLPPMLPALLPTPLPQPMMPPVMPPLVQPPVSQHVLPPLTSPPFSAGLLAAISHHERKKRETGSAQPAPGTATTSTTTTSGAAAGHKPFHPQAEEPIKSPFGVVKASWLPVFSDSQKSKRLPTPSMMNDYYATSPRIFPHLCSLCNLECTHMKDWILHQNNPAHLESCRKLRQQ